MGGHWHPAEPRVEPVARAICTPFQARTGRVKESLLPIAVVSVRALDRRGLPPRYNQSPVRIRLIPGRIALAYRMISFMCLDIVSEAAVIRTVISMTEGDKAWLDRRAKEEGVTMTELVRRAVRFYRSFHDSSDAEFFSLLRGTTGVWRAGDGLDYQRRVRDEWES